MTHSHHAPAAPDDRRTSGARPRPATWAVGTMVFAAMAMAMVGFFQSVMGLVALFGNEVYVRGARYVFSLDTTVWGWTHLLIGVLLLAAAFTLRTARPWARAVGIALAVVSALANFLFIPYYPVWPILIIVLDAVVIAGLCRYDTDAARA